VTFGLKYSYNAGVNLNQTLFNWQLMFQSKISKVNTKLKHAEKSLFEQNLKEQLAQVYYATLTALAAVDNSNKDLSLADSILQITKDRLREGYIDALSYNQAKINRNNAYDKLEQNKQYLYENEYNLKFLLGLSASDTLLLKEQIEIKQNSPMEALFPNILSTDLYRIQVEISELERKKALGLFKPKLDLVYYWGGIQYQQDFNFSFNSKDWQPNSYLGINLSIPLFTGFSNKNQYSSAKISQNIAKLNYNEEIRKSSLNDSILLNNYLSSIRLAQVASENLKLSNLNKQLAYSKYSEGLISLDNYLTVFDDYLAVESQYFSRLSDYMINKAIILARN
jgi:outer membrane protein TolC